MDKMKCLFIYAGTDKENYDMVQPTIIKQNRITVQTISFIAAVLLSAMYFSSYIVKELSVNRAIYIVGFAISLVIFMLALGPAKSYCDIVIPLMYLSYSAYYTYAIAIGTFAGRDGKFFMILIVFLPILFVGKPIRFITLTAAFIGVFIHLCFIMKTGYALYNDVLDAVIFGLLGMAAGTASSVFKVGHYVQEMLLMEANEKLTGLSRFDTLTGLKNRNAYESDICCIAKKCYSSLGCVYVDVNGLKYVNDNKGHEEGDKILKTVADEIKKHFGEDYTYRIGGDEFVVFVPDPEWFEIKTKTDDILAKIQPRSYYAAIGWKVHDLDVLSMEKLVEEAESYMYEKKNQFYSDSEFDRRKPRKPILHTQSLEEALESQDS